MIAHTPTPQISFSELIEDISGGTSYDQESLLCSIAISLKRMADVIAEPLIELPLLNAGVTHVRPSRISSVSIHGRHKDMTFVQMIGDSEETGFTVTLSVAETVQRLAKVEQTT